MGNVQVRLPDDLEGDLEDLADELETNRSEAIRRALAEGLESIRVQRALNGYLREEVTLARAAELAGVSLQRMAREASEAGVPFMRYPPEGAEEDLRTVASWEGQGDQAGGEADEEAGEGEADSGGTAEGNAGQDPADPDTG